MSASIPRRRQGRTGRRWVARDEMSIRGEAEYIAERAMEGDARIVTLGPLLLFSTETGDAWVLDPGDHLALCLAKGGEPLPAEIAETEASFTIGWNAHYAVDGDIFAVVESSGPDRAIAGYPVEAIRRTIRQMSGRVIEEATPGQPRFTKVQGQYLAFIAAYTQLNRRPPAETDIQRYFKVTPPSVHNMILTLERRGLIRRTPGQARSIEVLVPREQLPMLE